MTVPDFFSKRKALPKKPEIPTGEGPPKLGELFPGGYKEGANGACWFQVVSPVMDYMPDEKGEETAQFVASQLQAFARLKQRALSVYDAFMTADEDGTFAGFTVNEPFVFIASAYAALDALACGINAILRGKVSTSFPDLSSPKISGDFATDVSQLSESPWVKELRVCRRYLVHRGFDLSWCTSGNTYLTSLNQKPREIDLKLIVKGMIGDFQKWEMACAPKLEICSAFKPTLKDTILGIGLNSKSVHITGINRSTGLPSQILLF